ncbi:hypothetical protein [Halomontanus rarus]|uniref:hypothetical protein n=1 Tax=Halomontanus rarus TaxID=3034020 RepID=UPI001A986BC7
MTAVALWTYPWTLHREGIDDACERLEECGVDAVNVASHYHSVRSMQARFPDELFRTYAGGCYFEPDSDDRFEDVPIEPPVNRVGSWDDPLAEIVDGVHDNGLAVNAWTVCLHNTRLGATNPDYRIESAFGDAHDHSLCPSHPDVRDYFAAVVGSVRDRGVDEIQLESIGFPSAFHDHGSQYGHDKRQTVTTDTEEFLLSQCFCDGCRAAAESHSVDFDRARERVRELLERSLADPAHSPPSVDDLADREPVVADLLEFRASMIEALLERLADASGSTPLNYYVMEAYGFEPSTLPYAGVRFETLEAHLDRVTALCYVSESEVARDRITALERRVDLPIDAGITLDPDVVDRPEQVGDLLDAIRTVTDGTVSIYHHSLATETHLEWIAEALESEVE